MWYHSLVKMIVIAAVSIFCSYLIYFKKKILNLEDRETELVEEVQELKKELEETRV